MDGTVIHRRPTTWQNQDGTWSTRFTVRGKKRTFRLRASIATQQAADARANHLAAAAKLFSTGDERTALEQLELIATATTAELNPRVKQAAKAANGFQPSASSMPTFKKFATSCIDGTLKERFPDNYDPPSDDSCQDIGGIFTNHIFPVIGDVPLDCVDMDLGTEVSRRLPPDLSRNTRTNILGRIPWVMNLAVFPARLIERSPFPSKWTPSRGEPREHQFLYPDEDLALMRHQTIPLCWRIFWGWLARQGQRDSEAMRMNIADVDLVHGVVRIGKNKTSKRGRSWELAPGDLIAMRNYIERYRRNAKPTDPLFLNSKGTRIKPSAKPAPILRAHLRMIGLDKLRPQLFEDTDERMIFHVHNLRSTFITVSLAADESEAWVMRRTGHKTSRMLATYTGDVDMLRALKQLRLTTLDLAIPELGDRSTPTANPGKAPSVGQRSDSGFSNSAQSLTSAAIWHFVADGLQACETTKKPTIPTLAGASIPAQSAIVGPALSESDALKLLAALTDRVRELRAAASAVLPRARGEQQKRLRAAIAALSQSADR